MTFGEKCLNFRARFSLTQKELAQMFDVTPLMIYKYESGVTNPRDANKVRFLQIMESTEVNFK